MLKQLRDRQWIATAISRFQAMTPKRPTRQRAVYVVQYGELFKIGLSFDPMQRIKAFMLPELVATIRVYWVPRAEQFERLLHRHYMPLRERGEWFRLPIEVFAEMDSLAEKWKRENQT